MDEQFTARLTGGTVQSAAPGLVYVASQPTAITRIQVTDAGGGTNLLETDAPDVRATRLFGDTVSAAAPQLVVTARNQPLKITRALITGGDDYVEPGVVAPVEIEPLETVVPKVLFVSLAEVSNRSLTSASHTEVGLFANSNVHINEGRFTFEDSAGRRRIIFPETGRYSVDLKMVFRRRADTLAQIQSRLTLVRGSQSSALPWIGGSETIPFNLKTLPESEYTALSEYEPNTVYGTFETGGSESTRTHIATTAVSAIIDVEAGDRLQIRASTDTTKATPTDCGLPGSHIRITQIVRPVIAGDAGGADGVVTGISFSIPSDNTRRLTVARSEGRAGLQADFTVPRAQVQPNWNALSGLGAILNKPAILDAGAVTTLINAELPFWVREPGSDIPDGKLTDNALRNPITRTAALPAFADANNDLIYGVRGPGATDNARSLWYEKEVLGGFVTIRIDDIGDWASGASWAAEGWADHEGVPVPRPAGYAGSRWLQSVTPYTGVSPSVPDGLHAVVRVQDKRANPDTWQWWIQVRGSIYNAPTMWLSIRQSGSTVDPGNIELTRNSEGYYVSESYTHADFPFVNDSSRFQHSEIRLKRSDSPGDGGDIGLFPTDGWSRIVDDEYLSEAISGEREYVERVDRKYESVTDDIATRIGALRTVPTGGTTGQYLTPNLAWADLPSGGGGGSGTTVVANPAGTDGVDLTRLGVGGVNYVIPTPTPTPPFRLSAVATEAANVLDTTKMLMSGHLSSSGNEYITGFQASRYFRQKLGYIDSNDSTRYYGETSDPAGPVPPKHILFKGSGVVLSGSAGTAVATIAGAPDQVQPNWNATSGLGQILNKPVLSTVATTGRYADLTGTPMLSAVATSGAYGDISGTPQLSPVATSGAYADLTGTPTIPSVAGLFNQAQVDARIDDRVEPWALDAFSNTRIPTGKLGLGSNIAANVLHGDGQWRAASGNDYMTGATLALSAANVLSFASAGTTGFTGFTSTVDLSGLAGAGGGGFGTELVGSVNADITTANQFIATGISLPAASEVTWLLVNTGQITSTQFDQAGYRWIKLADLLAKTSTAGTAATNDNSIELFREVTTGFVVTIYRVSTIASTRELLITSNGSGRDALPLTVEKVVAGGGGGGGSGDNNYLNALSVDFITTGNLRNQFRITGGRTGTIGSVVSAPVGLPLHDWAFSSDSNGVPYSSLPEMVTGIGSPTYDDSTKRLTIPRVLTGGDGTNDDRTAIGGYAALPFPDYNPVIPGGVTPTRLDYLKVGSDYYDTRGTPVSQSNVAVGTPQPLNYLTVGATQFDARGDRVAYVTDPNAAFTESHVGLNINGVLSNFSFEGSLTSTVPQPQFGAAYELNPYATNANQSTDHGMGLAPQHFIIKLVCLTAEQGYVAGDEVLLYDDESVTTSTGNPSYWVTTSDVLPQIADRDSAPRALRNITPARWKLVVTPWTFADLPATAFQGPPGRDGTTLQIRTTQAFNGNVDIAASDIYQRLVPSLNLDADESEWIKVYIGRYDEAATPDVRAVPAGWVEVNVAQLKAATAAVGDTPSLTNGLAIDPLKRSVNLTSIIRWWLSTDSTTGELLVASEGENFDMRPLIIRKVLTGTAAGTYVEFNPTIPPGVTPTVASTAQVGLDYFTLQGTGTVVTPRSTATTGGVIRGASLDGVD